MGSWLRIEGEGVPGGELRRPLGAGLTRVGGKGCEVEVASTGADQLHVWSDPARLGFVGVGARPQVDGRDFEERHLNPGDRIRWGALTLTYERDPDPALLEEVALRTDPPSAEPPGWRRLRAGMAAELGLLEIGAVRRWQESVRRGTFDPDACADELLAQPLNAPSEQRLVDRAGKLQRDLLMAPLQRGGRGVGRAVRGATRTGLAYLTSQLMVAVIFALLFAIVLLLVRLRWKWSVDAFLDSVLDLVPG